MRDYISIIAADGYALTATRFSPKEQNNKIVVICSATGVKQRFYEHFAAYLARIGYVVYTFDYRGIGLSRPASLRSFEASMKDWAILDLRAVLHHVTQLYPRLQLVIIGHSVGGQLIGMVEESFKAEALIFIAAQTPFWKHYGKGFQRLKLIYFWYLLIPLGVKIFNYFPAKRLGLFEDLPRKVALQWASWAKNKNYVFDEEPAWRTQFKALSAPKLFIRFSDDSIAPEKAVKDLQQFFDPRSTREWLIDAQQLQLEEVGHFGFFRKETQEYFWPPLAARIESLFQERIASSL